MKQYDTVIDAIDGLKKRGFAYDFNLDEKQLLTNDSKEKFTSDEFKIVEVYRFEGTSNPDESSIVYAIESAKYNLKGFRLNAYGIYADNNSTEIAKKMEIEHKEVT